MTDSFVSEGLTIAPGVIETILAQAVLQIEGVARIGSTKPTDGLFTGSKRRGPVQGILLVAEDRQISVTVHINVFFGFRLQEVAEQVRNIIADTLLGQIGIVVKQVDVFIESIVFPE